MRIDVGTAVGRPGSIVGFAVTLDASGPVASIAMCVGYDALTPINATSTGDPDCTLGMSIDGSFVFGPAGCTPPSECSRVCSSLNGTPTISDGATLFTCRVAIDPAAPVASYALPCTADANSTAGPAIASCTPGQVIVETRIPGDCDGDGKVTIDELITAVNIALGSLPVTACPAFDTNADGQVTIEDLIAAVNAALSS